MTIENCKKLLDHYKASMDDSSLTEQARLNAKIAYENMLNNLEARGAGIQAESEPVEEKKSKGKK